VRSIAFSVVRQSSIELFRTTLKAVKRTNYNVNFDTTCMGKVSKMTL